MDCALEVFDLIHAWGGRMGRNPYVLKKSGKKTVREDCLEWFTRYQDGINSAKRQNPESALSEFCKIPESVSSCSIHESVRLISNGGHKAGRRGNTAC